MQTTYEKVVDKTYEGEDGEVDREKITTSKDIGIIGQCLDECSRRGSECLAVTMLNERGGRQRCFSLSDSAAKTGADLEDETGVTYYEKICTSKNY